MIKLSSFQIYLALFGDIDLLYESNLWNKSEKKTIADSGKLQQANRDYDNTLPRKLVYSNMR